MGFNYYEGPIDDAEDVETKFVFLVYNNGTCHQTYCSDVCNWQLNVNPQVRGGRAAGEVLEAQG
jgi:hypothetical protein